MKANDGQTRLPRVFSNLTLPGAGAKGEGAIKALPGLTKPGIIEAAAAHCPGWGGVAAGSVITQAGGRRA